MVLPTLNLVVRGACAALALGLALGGGLRPSEAESAALRGPGLELLGEARLAEQDRYLATSLDLQSAG